MTTAVPATALAAIQPAFTDAERLALAGFLVGYRGLTREAYALDLRQFTTWCRARSLALFAVRGAASNPSPGSWRLEAGPGRPSHSGCAPSPGSAGTRSKKSSSGIPLQLTSAVRGWASCSAHAAANGLLTEYGWTRPSACRHRRRPASA